MPGAQSLVDRFAVRAEAGGGELIEQDLLVGVLQRWLNAFNARRSKYPDMFVDGRLGPISLDALRKFLAWRGLGEGGAVLLKALNSAQAVRYLEIAEASKSQEDFIYGWIRSRA